MRTERCVDSHESLRMVMQIGNWEWLKRHQGAAFLTRPTYHVIKTNFPVRQQCKQTLKDSFALV
jgi:hypothetical protein